MSKQHNLKIEFTQSTSGDPDNETVISESSDDPAIHLIKTKVFSKHLTAAADAITQELCDIGLGALGADVTGGKGKK